MKHFFIKILFLLAGLSSCMVLNGQYHWKLSREKDGIKVYQSPVKNSNFKSIKVECTLQGTFDKLIKIITNVSHLKDWVYNNKTAYVLHQDNPYDYYYYTEFYLPWPASNRDAVEHLKITRDSLDRFLKITSVGEPRYIPEKNGKVRVPHSFISWYVTAPASGSIHIEYRFEAEPGGNLPAWLVNLFADKGPVETFKKLSELLKK